MVNVQRPKPHAPLHSVAAKVTGTARDLFGNKRELVFNKTEEEGATDYIAQTQVKNEQTLIFDLEVTPQEGPTKALQFKQQFYTR